MCNYNYQENVISQKLTLSSKMKNTYKFLFLSIAFIVSCSCSKDDYIAAESSPVILDLTQVPYPKLSDYVFFKEVLKNQNPVYGVLPFQPVSNLFSDYALKKRFIWLPDGTKASYNGDENVLNLPNGSALIKTFYYDNVQPGNTTKILETRILIKKQNDWMFANYVWNEEQTEAFLNLDGVEVDITWRDNNNTLRSTTYKIASEGDCIACHRDYSITKDFPIGIKPQNLNFPYTYPEGTNNQLQKWIDFGYLQDNLPANILSVIDYEDDSQPLDLRARSYLDANCSGCHKNGGHADFYVLRLAFNLTTNLDNLGICVSPNHTYMPGFDGKHLIKPGDHENSLLHARMNTNDFYYRMPSFGRTIIHDEGVALIAEWIDSLPGKCD